ncbi:hypothetical protein EDC94DRAFT_518663, partial [Helicostylum pulchrum]
IFELARQRNYVQKISVVLEKLQILPFRKLKFSSKLYLVQNDKNLVKLENVPLSSLVIKPSTEVIALVILYSDIVFYYIIKS